MRFNLTIPETIEIRESKGLVKDIYDPAIAIRQPVSEYQVMLNLIHRSDTLATAYNILVDFLTYRGWDFIRGNKAQRDELRQIFTDLNFRQALPNICYQLLYYGDCFLEKRKNNSAKVNELWPLETTEMRIIFDEHGKVHGYVQRNFSLNGMTEDQILAKEKKVIPLEDGGDGKQTYGVFWAKDEIIHFRMKWIGSQVYSYNPNEPIAQVAATSLYAGNYLMNIFINMPPRYVAHLSGISQSDHNKAKTEFQSAKTNYKKTIAFTRSSDPNSKLSLEKIEPPYDAELMAIMKYLDAKLLKITRVPKTWVEGADTENRGVGESLMLPFEACIKSIHRNILEPQINSDLLSDLGYYKKGKESESYVEFKFNEPSLKAETDILANAASLQAMGLKSEALVRYLDFNGILGLDPEDFEDLRAMEMFSGTFGKGFSKDGEGKVQDTESSRRPMNPRMESMTQNRDSAGTSKESAKRMKLPGAA